MPTAHSLLDARETRYGHLHFGATSRRREVSAERRKHSPVPEGNGRNGRSGDVPRVTGLGEQHAGLDVVVEIHKLGPDGHTRSNCRTRYGVNRGVWVALCARRNRRSGRGPGIRLQSREHRLDIADIVYLRRCNLRHRHSQSYTCLGPFPHRSRCLHQMEGEARRHSMFPRNT